jgi:ATP-dependent protease ClpP protease subunit
MLIALSIIIICKDARSAEIIPLTVDNHVYLKGEVNEETMREATVRLLELNFKLPAKTPIYIIINSGGGSVVDGLGFIRTMELVKLIRPVHTYSIWSFSMAFSISQHGDIRYIDPAGLTGQHRAKGSFSGQFAEGEVEARLKVFTSVVASLNKYEANRCGYSLEEWKNKIRDEFWGFSDVAIIQGMSDKVATISCSKELFEKIVTKTYTDMFGGSVEVKESACPLAAL